MKTTKILLAFCLMIFAQNAHSQPWNTLGNTGGAGVWLGTNNPTPLDIKTNSLNRMYITSTGNIGINTIVPEATLHINGYNSNLTKGIFTVRFPNGSGTALLNTEFSALTRPGTGLIGGNGFTALYAKSGNTTGTAAGYFDGKVIVTNGSVGIGTQSPYKLFTVNGDVSLANYNSSGTGNTGNGFNGLEILGNGQVPTRRGISLDNDPNGSFNFYVNSNQGPSAFNFKNGNGLATPLMTINAVNKNVGIGTASPMQTLDVKGNISVNDNAILLHFSNDLNHGLRYAGAGYPFAANAAIDGPAIYGYGGGVLGLKNSGGNTEKIALLWDINGNVGIGTDLASNTYNSINNYFKLSVNGSIRTKEVIVETGWADFVFKKNYRLKPLKEVEQFIKQNGHLPEIPSANEIEKNGGNVGELLKLQMQKIEELTLYIIEQDKKTQQMQKELNELKGRKYSLKEK